MNENEINASINTKLASGQADGISADEHREVAGNLANNDVYILESLFGVGDYAGNAEKLIVNDSEDGGVWVYTTANLAPSSPQIITASGKGAGYWVKVGHLSSQIPILEGSKIPNSYLDLLAFADAFGGVALPTDDPGEVSSPMYWLAAGAGNYVNFGGAVVSDDVAWLIWNGSDWELYEFNVNVYGTPQVVVVNASRSMVASDAQSILSIEADSKLTIPLNSQVPFPVDTVINLERITSGDAAIQASVGVELNGVDGAMRNIDTQYGGAYLRQYAIDKWILVGNIS